MYQQTLRGLPEELITLILEYVCELIVQELTAFPRQRLYGATLNHFLRLLLVSRCFHRILTLYIRVDGIPVRERLLDLQMQRLRNFFEFGRYKHISRIRQTCGNVWGNPGSPSLILKLFVEECYQGPNVAFFHMCLLPKLLGKGNLTAADKEEASPSGPGGLGFWEEQDDSSDDDRNTTDERPGLGDLIRNKTYKMKTSRHWLEKTIEFVVGRYKFPIRLPDQTTMGSDSVKGEWIGTSILSFKESITAPSREIGEKTFNGEDGRYWLWFMPPKNEWILIDYVTSIAMDHDGFEFDLRKYGRPILEDE